MKSAVYGNKLIFCQSNNNDDKTLAIQPVFDQT